MNNAEYEDLDERLRKIEHQMVEKNYVLTDCAALRDRVANLEIQVRPLLTLSTQLSAVTGQLSDLRTELASFKGRAVGIMAAITFAAPLLASGSTALVMRLLRIS